MRRPPVPAPVSHQVDSASSRTPTSSPTRDLQRAGVVLLALTLTGCLHTQAYKAATLLNEYDYRENRYEEACLPFSTKAFCSTAQLRLQAAKRHVVEAATAVHNGGDASLQINLAKKDIEGLKDVQ